MSASTINLAVIPGDGIGPEVIAEALKVLEKAVAAEGIVLQQTHYKLGAQHWLETGETLPDEILADLRTRDAILFGAVGAAPGDTRIPSGIIERECSSSCASAWTTSSTCGPHACTAASAARWPTPANIDFIVVREGTEGPYVGNGGTLRAGTPARGGHRGLAEHRPRRGARGPRRLPPRQRPPPQEADPRPQAQRPGLRRPPLEAHRRGRGPGVPRGHATTTCTSTPPRSSWSPTRPAST